MKNYIFLFVSISLSFMANSQDDQKIDIGPGNLMVPEGHAEASVIDGVYQKKDMMSKRRPVQYEHVREADYVWGKRTWSYIDLREKINHPFLFPLENTNPETGEIKENTQGRYSLYLIIRKACEEGQVIAYSPGMEVNLSKGIFTPTFDGDAFKYPVRRDYSKTISEDGNFIADLGGLLGSQDVSTPYGVTDNNGDPYYYKSEEEYNKYKETGYGGKSPDVITSTYDEAWLDNGNPQEVETRDTITTKYRPQDIVKYYIKEDWYFDKERSVFKPRIIGIAPVVIKAGQEKPIFWIYFPQLRQVIKNYYSFNTKNDAQWMSFDDLFWKRKFNAIIYKQSNRFDRSIEQYRFGADALYESKKVKDKMRDFEHDVWNF
jgi:gliding motility associated protien GldN